MKLRYSLTNIVAVILMVFFFAGTLCAKTNRLPQLVAARVFSGPTLDGKLDDAVWKNVPESNGFVLLGTQNKPAKFQTYVKAVADKEALYIGFRCVEPMVADLPVRNDKRDELTGQEAVEIVIDPTGEETTAYHLIINVNGGQHDAKLGMFMTGALTEEPKWDGDWQAATSRGNKEWYVEARLPFSTFGIDVTKNLWPRINFSRSRFVGEAENASWSQNILRYIESVNMGELIIPKIDGSYCAVKFPRLATTVTGKNNIPFEIVNNSKQTIIPKFIYEITGAKPISGSLQLGKLVSGKKLAAHFPLNLEQSGYCKMIVSVVDTISSNKIYSFKREINVINPVDFDEALYALYHKRADATIHVNVPYDKAVLKISLLKNGTKSPVASKKFFSGLGGPVKVSFDMKDQSKGAYTMRAELIRGNKTYSASQSRVFPYKPDPKIGFNEDGIMLLDKKPFFPVGIYSLRARAGTPPEKVDWLIENVMQEAKQAGFNTTVLYDENLKDLNQLLDACQRHDIKAFVYPTVPFSKMKGVETPDTMRRDIDARRNHPAIAGWYVVDEPEGIGLAPVNKVRDRYQLIKEYDQDHPCTSVIMSADAAKQFNSSTDVMWTDPYPLPALPVTVVSDVVRDSIKNIEKDKPLWDVTQAFDWTAYNTGKLETAHRPTPEEDRCMAYLAIVNGAKGVIFWPHSASVYCIRDYPEHWNAVKRTAGEMRDLTPVLITKTINGKLTFAPANKAIQTMLKKVNGEWYAFAVNSATEPCEASFVIPGLANGADVEVMFENRKLSVDSGKWNDAFKPLEVHVYRVSAKR